MSCCYSDRSFQAARGSHPADDTDREWSGQTGRQTDPWEPVEGKSFPGARACPQREQCLGTDSTGLDVSLRDKEIYRTGGSRLEKILKGGQDERLVFESTRTEPHDGQRRGLMIA